MSEIERNKQVALRTVEELFNKVNLSVVDELVAEDAVDHQLPLAPTRASSFKEDRSGTARGLPRLPDERGGHVRGRRQAGRPADDERNTQGVFQGPNPLRACRPRGRASGYSSCGWMSVADGKMVDAWWIADWPGMMQQLGLTPRRPELAPVASPSSSSGGCCPGITGQHPPLHPLSRFGSSGVRWCARFSGPADRRRFQWRTSIPAAHMATLWRGSTLPAGRPAVRSALLNPQDSVLRARGRLVAQLPIQAVQSSPGRTRLEDERADAHKVLDGLASRRAGGRASG